MKGIGREEGRSKEGQERVWRFWEQRYRKWRRRLEGRCEGALDVEVELFPDFTGVGLMFGLVVDDLRDP